MEEQFRPKEQVGGSSPSRGTKRSSLEHRAESTPIICRSRLVPERFSCISAPETGVADLLSGLNGSASRHGVVITYSVSVPTAAGAIRSRQRSSFLDGDLGKHLVSRESAIQWLREAD